MQGGSGESPWRVKESGSVLNQDSDRIKCPILRGAISGNQDLKWPYLGKILDTSEVSFAVASGT
jgi:hypothetical protein